MTELKHAKLSASGSATWLVCAASMKMQALVPDRGSEYAAEGTAAHEIAARCLKNECDASFYADMEIEVCNETGDAWVPAVDGPSDREPHVEFRTFVCTPEMVDAVQMFVDAVRARNADELLVERRVDYSHYVPDGFGTVDAGSVCVGEKTLYVDDLKYGANVKVDAAVDESEQLYALGTRGNPQALLYATAMLLEVDLFHEIDRVVVGIHQPRMDHVDEFEISREDLFAWAETVVRPAAQRAHEADTAAAKWFAPGEKTCRWCKVKNLCAHRDRWIMDAAASDFQPVPLDDDLADLVDQVQTMSDEGTHPGLADLAARIPRLRDLAKWAKQTLDFLEAEAAAGVSIPGYKLVATEGNRTWADPEKAERAVRRELGAAEAYDKRLLTPPALQKKLGKAAKGHLLLSDKYVTRPAGKPTLVPDSDPRPSIAENAADGFEAVDQ